MYFDIHIISSSIVQIYVIVVAQISHSFTLSIKSLFNRIATNLKWAGFNQPLRFDRQMFILSNLAVQKVVGADEKEDLKLESRYNYKKRRSLVKRVYEKERQLEVNIFLIYFCYFYFWLLLIIRTWKARVDHGLCKYTYFSVEVLSPSYRLVSSWYMA